MLIRPCLSAAAPQPPVRVLTILRVCRNSTGRGSRLPVIWLDHADVGTGVIVRAMPDLHKFHQAKGRGRARRLARRIPGQPSDGTCAPATAYAVAGSQP